MYPIKNAFRFLSKNNRTTLINMLGLTVGMAGVLLIFFFLHKENAMDKFHKRGEDIYRITSEMTLGAADMTRYVNSPPALAGGIEELFPEVIRSTRLRYVLRATFTHEVQTFYEDLGYYADSSFLEIFDYKLLEGDRKTALDEPNSILVTEELATKYFGTSDVIGKTLFLNHDIPLQITGILASVPVTSHLQFDFLISFPTYTIPEGYYSDLTSWTWAGFLTYALLEPGSDPDILRGKINQLYVEKMPGPNIKYEAVIQPLEDIYLGSREMIDDLNSHIRQGNAVTNRALFVVAILILFIAGLNFTNLTVAISLKRGKEMGMRQVLGAHRSGIVIQLLTESLIICFLSLALALMLVWLATPFISNFLSLNFQIDWDTVLRYMPLILIASGILGTVVTLYPAYLLMQTNFTEALKGKVQTLKGSKSGVRNGLLAIQFSISAGLVIATVVITRQLDFIQNKSLGFEKENVMVLKLQPRDMRSYFARLKTVLEQNPHVMGVSRSERLIGEPWPTNSILPAGWDESETKRVMGNLVGLDFLETLGINLTRGRSFEQGRYRDSTNAIILNEKAVAHLGLEDPIGMQVDFFSRNGPRTVIGVVEDFNFSTLHEEIKPMVLVMPFVDIEHVYVRIHKGNPSEIIESIQSDWQKAAPMVPMDFRFLDDHLNNLYSNTTRLSYLINIFSMLAIFLSILGLISLVSLTVTNRMKEMSIRKVLGASTLLIMGYLSRTFFWIIGMAILLSFPAVHFFLDAWLADFAFRIDPGWEIYLGTLIILLVLSMAVVNMLAIKAAHANPSDVLRKED